MKRALITGVTGQDGYYLSRLLVNYGYDVYGLVRRTSQASLEGVHPSVKVVYGDLCDQKSLDLAVQQTQPHEVYNLAAQSFVAASFTSPNLTYDITGAGVLKILEAVINHCPTAKFYQAGSSEMFGDVQCQTQDENTPFRPRSPYGVAKVSGHYFTKVYRESYGLFACNGILFNHESPRRGPEFVTRKITKWIGENHKRPFISSPLRLGNLDAERDWGYAGDYVKAMHMMLQQSQPDDYVISTGEVHSVREFCELAFAYSGMGKIEWYGHGDQEIGVCGNQTVIIVDPKFYRPAEVNYLCGNYDKAYRAIGWKPEVSFQQLVKYMVYADMGIEYDTSNKADQKEIS